ncbi:MAG: LEA type 2 family protein [Balneolaceae bacterium]|nr:LEA type 2 family protein [Balneolaceae bacterium]
MKASTASYCSLLLITGLLFHSGCSALGDFSRNIQKPNLSVENVRVTGFNFREIELTYDVNVDNPNNLAVDLLQYDYELHLNDNSFARGKQSKKMRIEGSGSTQLEVPLTLNYREVFNAITSLESMDEARYAFKSTLTFDLPVIGRTEVPVNKTGTVPLLKMPDIRIRDFSIRSLGFTEADLNLEISFDNPNGFALAINRLDYALQVNGDHWSDGTVLEDVLIGEHGVTELEIPISLSIEEIGLSAFRVLSKAEKLTYDLSGTLDLNIGHELLGNTTLAFDRTGSISLSN